MTDVVGGQFGEVEPKEPPPPTTGYDAREHALRALRRYIGALAFFRKMPAGQAAQRFHLPLKAIHVYQPDDIEDAETPGLGIRPGRGKHDACFLGPPQMLDETRDVYGHGTVLIRLSEYVETIALNVLGAKHAERVAVVSGLETVLRLGESSYALLLKVPSYYDRVASFSLMESEYMEDDNTFKNRRRADLYVMLRIPEVTPVRYRDFRPEAILDVSPEPLF